MGKNKNTARLINGISVDTSFNTTILGSLTINKISGASKLHFPAATNDSGFIHHEELSPDISRMVFSVSDNSDVNDYFSFGSTPSGVYTEGLRIAANGTLTGTSIVLSSGITATLGIFSSDVLTTVAFTSKRNGTNSGVAAFNMQTASGVNQAAWGLIGDGTGGNPLNDVALFLYNDVGSSTGTGIRFNRSTLATTLSGQLSAPNAIFTNYLRVGGASEPSSYYMSFTSSVIGIGDVDFSINTYITGVSKNIMYIDTSSGAVAFNNTVFASTGFVADNANGIRLYTESNGASWYIRSYNAASNQLRFNYQGTDLGRISGVDGTYAALSDRNKKKNFEAYTGGLNEVLQLLPTLYNIKTQEDTEPKELGFIAQEVQSVIPQAYTEAGDFIGLNYNAFTPVLVNAIKELKAENDEFRAILERNNLI